MKKTTLNSPSIPFLQFSIWVSILTTVSFLLSFNYKEVSNAQPNFKSSFPIIIDNSVTSSGIHKKNALSYANYDILYLGNEKDTIYINRHSSPFKNHVKGFDVYEKYKSDKFNIQIGVDVSQIIKHDVITRQIGSNYVDAYPVFIKNLEPDPIIIGYTAYEEHLSLLLEAKDETGKWRPIEESYFYLCGFGIFPIVLPPNKMIVTAVKIYSGDYKTELRLKFGKKYSAPFKGSINLSQFSK